MTYTSNQRGEVDEDRKLYALTFGGFGITGDEFKAQIAGKADRIAACLNFCQGFLNSQLEATSMREISTAFCHADASAQVGAYEEFHFKRILGKLTISDRKVEQ